MSILGSANYMIYATFTDPNDPRCANGPHKERYVDNFDNLRRTIATTWSKIPTVVKVEGHIVKVLKEGSDQVLAEFEFSMLALNKLPDHF